MPGVSLNITIITIDIKYLFSVLDFFSFLSNSSIGQKKIVAILLILRFMVLFYKLIILFWI